MITTNEKKVVSDKFNKHRGPVTGVAQIGNSSWVITSAYDGAVAKFNHSTKVIKLLGYHDHLVNRIVVNDEGTQAASCSSDYTIGIWNLTTGRLQAKLLGHSDDVEDFVFVNEHVGVSASRDQRILIWDLYTGGIVKIIDGHEKDVLSLAYHNGKIYSTGDDKTLRVWDVDTGEELNKWGPFDVETDTCAIDLINERVVLGCDDGYIRIFSIIDGALLHEIKAHTSGIKKVACSPIDGTLLSAAYDQRIRIWDSNTLEEKLELENNPIKWERSLVWSTDGKTIFAGTFDGTILMWDAVTGAFLQEVGNETEREGNACFNEVSVLQEDKVVSVSDDGFVRLIDLVNYASVKQEPSSGRFLMNAITSHKDVVISGSHNQRLHYYKALQNTLSYEKEVLIDEGPINSVRISELADVEGHAFVACYSGAIVHVDRDGELVNKIQVHDGAVKSLRLHSSLPYGVSCSAGGELRSWDYEGNVYQEYLGHTAIINDVDISASGDRIASVSRDFTLKLYDFHTGQLVNTFGLGRRSLKSVCIFDEATIVVGDYWGHLISVDIVSGKSHSVKIATNGISSVCRMGEGIVASSYDGGIYHVHPQTLNVVKSFKEMNQIVSL